MFSARRMLFGTVCSLAVTFSVAASESDLPLARSRPVTMASHSVPSIRTGGGKPHANRWSAQQSKANAKIKRAELLEPRYWGAGESSTGGNAEFPIALASGGQPKGQTPHAVLMRTASHAPDLPSGQPRVLGEAGGRVGGEPPMQPSSLLSGAVSGLSPPPGSSLPFIFVGRLIDKAEVTLFLLGNNRPILAKVHDVIDGTYRVDRINNGDAILTYLPTNMQQTLVFNSTAIGASALSSPARPAANSNPIDGAVTTQNAIGARFANIADQAKSR